MESTNAGVIRMYADGAKELEGLKASRGFTPWMQEEEQSRSKVRLHQTLEEHGYWNNVYRIYPWIVNPFRTLMSRNVTMREREGLLKTKDQSKRNHRLQIAGDLR